MNVLVLYAHPVETSYQAALHERAVAALTEAGHDVDDCDLYAEGFDPVLGRSERLGYHDTATNTAPVKDYVERLKRAEALVLVFPTWCYGPPAILKGFFDRVLLPGFAFRLTDDGKVEPNLRHIRKLAAVVTYGRGRLASLYMGDPPRKYVTRYWKWYVRRGAKITYLAHYDMNRSTPAGRERFLERVGQELARF